jgi:DNA-binding NarL/FixJ family response regulator
MSIRVLLSGKHRIALNGLKGLLDREPDLEVAAPCTSMDETLAGVRHFAPDVVFVDCEPGDGEAAALLARIQIDSPRTRLALLALVVGADELVEALRMGATGVAVAEMPPPLFVQCVRALHAGERWVEPGCLVRALETLRRREAAARAISRVLTPREMEVARIVALGMNNKEIAERLSIAEGTVKTHLHCIYEKLHVDGRRRLAQLVRERGLAARLDVTADDVARVLGYRRAKPSPGRRARER